MAYEPGQIIASAEGHGWRFTVTFEPAPPRKIMGRLHPFSLKLERRRWWRWREHATVWCETAEQGKAAMKSNFRLARGYGGGL